MAPSVLLVGLGVDHPEVPADFRASLPGRLAETKKLMLSAGYEFENLLTGPEDPGYTAPFEDALKKKKWDVVVVGFGVRGNPRLTVYFERLVNAVRELAPQAKIGFNTIPEETLDSAKRLAPV